ncbi:Spx/MgsR family RNA polymerase-binding regulatory protein [Sulfurimonas sp. SAG-AH-194-C20]|nr:Spx/MgsR family RNA polymerase-binding regulatory protein [Sulfurimonas sp. SAG-AH-194-C20]MDF1878995.1 Spx/MgsR family RNA polymerase-binding regulatory protein [Sulfurimonas sp. SAG-AH-194-C20]
MIQVYGIKNCDSVKKALKFFKNNNLEYTLFDFKTQSLPCEKVSSWLEQTQMKILFNARSTTFRNLKLKDLALDEKGQEAWLCKENLLIKRPVVEYDGKLMVGFNEENYQRSFL